MIDKSRSFFTTITNNNRAAAVAKRLAREGRYICSIYAYNTNYIFYYRKNNEGR